MTPSPFPVPPCILAPLPTVPHVAPAVGLASLTVQDPQALGSRQGQGGVPAWSRVCPLPTSNPGPPHPLAQGWELGAGSVPSSLHLLLMTLAGFLAAGASSGSESRTSLAAWWGWRQINTPAAAAGRQERAVPGQERGSQHPKTPRSFPDCCGQGDSVLLPAALPCFPVPAAGSCREMRCGQV